MYPEEQRESTIDAVFEKGTSRAWNRSSEYWTEMFGSFVREFTIPHLFLIMNEY
jgi:hypothetical protein